MGSRPKGPPIKKVIVLWPLLGSSAKNFARASVENNFPFSSKAMWYSPVVRLFSRRCVSLRVLISEDLFLGFRLDLTFELCHLSF